MGVSVLHHPLQLIDLYKYMCEQNLLKHMLTSVGKHHRNMDVWKQKLGVKLVAPL